MKTFILKQHTPGIVKQLKDAGIPCWDSVYHYESPWLYYYRDYVEAAGYPDSEEGTTADQELERFVDESEDPYYCKDVEEFIEKIKEQLKLIPQDESKAIDIISVLEGLLAGEDVSDKLRLYLDKKKEYLDKREKYLDEHDIKKY